ncbi:MAG TPA: stage V sporulation protein AD [Firmicutes bacterium]|nr:stage V sporulation protein AD [Bacillota bacterium]
MAAKRQGKRTVRFSTPPVIVATGTVVGPMEGKGPLASDFDVILPDLAMGQRTPERAETKILEEACNIALSAANLKPEDLEYMLAGDLLSQIISSSFAARQITAPYLGLYGACSTAAESLILGAMLIDGGFADTVLAATSSHYQTAERQYRYPIELNIQRKVTAQVTVTGASAAILKSQGTGPRITCATVGRVIDLGIKDSSDMGSAMAPAAADTLFWHLSDTNTRPEDYDLVLTGDLGRVGTVMLGEVLKDKGIVLGPNYNDCGLMIFSQDQDVGAGGSGCACSGVVAMGHIYKSMLRGLIKKVLLISTGALFSPLSFQQGETIPGIAHALVIEQA